MLREPRLDLPELDADATHLHLRVAAPEELQVAVGAPASESPVRYMRCRARRGSSVKCRAVSSGRPR